MGEITEEVAEQEDFSQALLQVLFPALLIILQLEVALLEMQRLVVTALLDLTEILHPYLLVELCL